MTSDSVQLPPSLTARLKSAALSLGFDLVGITSAEPSVFAEEYRDWIASGYAGEMEYLKRNLDRRLDPRELLPDAKSILVVGMNYYTRDPDPTVDGDNSVDQKDRAIFARYARGDDYHDVMTARLRTLLAMLKEQAGEGADGRVYVDAGPVLEREVARRAGLGWFGKNTMLINTRRGSYFFLGEIVTNVALEPDTPAVGSCGSCTRCIDACPTDAFDAPYRLDARRCISYLTIELKGPIPDEFHPALSAAGNRIYGCDICQEVCPFNRERGVEYDHYATCDAYAGRPDPSVLSVPSVPTPNTEHLTSDSAPPQPPNSGGSIHGSSPTSEPAFQPRPITTNPKLTDLLYMTQEEFSSAFKGSAVKRAKRRGLLRNAIAALARRDDPEAIAALEHAMSDPEELVSQAAEMALAPIHVEAVQA